MSVVVFVIRIIFKVVWVHDLSCSGSVVLVSVFFSSVRCIPVDEHKLLVSATRKMKTLCVPTCQQCIKYTLPLARVESFLN